MKRYQCLGSISFGLAALALLLLASPAQAHTRLLEPNGGEQLEVGSEFTVTWQVTGGNYNPLNWDLWYSTNSAGGPWLELAYDLPAGSGANGSIHTYDWTVPNVVDDSVWVRVRMDNSGVDYYDESDFPFSIVLPPPPPPGVPSGVSGTPLLVNKLPGFPDASRLDLTYDATTCTANTDHQIIHDVGSRLPSTLGGTYFASGEVCNIGSSGSHTWIGTPAPVPNDPLLWFLVLSEDNSGAEGSWGTDSSLSERNGFFANGSSGRCGIVTKSLSNTCGSP